MCDDGVVEVLSTMTPSSRLSSRSNAMSRSFVVVTAAYAIAAYLHSTHGYDVYGRVNKPLHIDASEVSCSHCVTGRLHGVRSSDRPVGPTQATSDCLSDQSDRPVGQTVAEPPTSVNQINVACELVIIPPTLQRDWSSDWPVGPTSRT